MPNLAHNARFVLVVMLIWLALAAVKRWHARQTWYECRCITCTHDPYWARVYGDLESNYTAARGAE